MKEFKNKNKLNTSTKIHNKTNNDNSEKTKIILKKETKENSEKKLCDKLKNNELNFKSKDFDKV
jgi:hypothetical protein